MVLITLEEADVVGALVFAHMRVVRCRTALSACTRPDKLTIVVVDVWSGIRVSVWRKEDVAWGNEIRSEDIKVDNGSM